MRLQDPSFDQETDSKKEITQMLESILNKRDNLACKSHYLDLPIKNEPLFDDFSTL